MNGIETVVLAFSGGLDTSYCVPRLIEDGWRVVTVHVDTGGLELGRADAIESRALELGAAEHVRVDAGAHLAERVVVPLVMSGALYQGKYPLLCADRYLIAQEMARVAGERGAAAVAHGCTAMGNDQVRFDVALRSLGVDRVLAPIRDLQGCAASPREHEIDYLRARGFAVPHREGRYSINENLLGTTASGSEIDRWESPADDCRRLCAPRSEWPVEPLGVRVGFERGVPTSIDDRAMGVSSILSWLNDGLGAYGVGRDIYTGDTVVGLKGRIVYEAPGLVGLLAAHRALAEAVLTAHQREALAWAGRRWADMVYTGLYFDPARQDVEALIRSAQHTVTGEVTLETAGGWVVASGVSTSNVLARRGAVYAQSADWSAQHAEGFIGIFGQMSVLGARARDSADGGAA